METDFLISRSDFVQRSRRRNLRGFERLRANGVTDEDIEHLRWQLFMNQEDDPALLPQPGEDTHDTEERWLRMYNIAVPGLALNQSHPQGERRVQRQPDHANNRDDDDRGAAPPPFFANLPEPPDYDEEGSYMDMFVGMLMGFTLGLIILLWIRSTPSSTSGWTRKKKFGILAGIGCNISFGIIRLSK